MSAGLNSQSLSISSLSEATHIEEYSRSSGSSLRIQDSTRKYKMVNPEKRMDITRRIDNGEMVSECKTGKRWWLSKHHPKREIPQNIYLLGNGTLQDLHQKYIAEYTKENDPPIEYKVFINYTRELIKQGIMY
jgi:hypothetical protein